MNKLFLCTMIVQEQEQTLALVCSKDKELAIELIKSEIVTRYGDQVDTSSLKVFNLGFALDHIKLGFVFNNLA